MKDPKDKEPRIEITPQKEIRFNQMVVDYFIVKILGIGSFMVTDESYVSDMLRPWGHKAKDLGNGKYSLIQTSYEAGRARQETGKAFWKLTEEEREKYKRVKEVILNKEDLAWVDDLVFRTWDFFGVEIEEKDLQGSFVDLGKKISSQLTEEKRNELLGSYPYLFDDAE